jgi:hypothetical protein
MPRPVKRRSSRVETASGWSAPWECRCVCRWPGGCGAAQRFPHEGLRAFVRRSDSPALTLHPLVFGRGSRREAGDLKEDLGPVLDQVHHSSGPRFSLPDILIQAAAAAEGKAASRDHEPVDGAIHLAGSAGEAADQLHLGPAQREQVDGMSHQRAGSLQRE